MAHVTKVTPNETWTPSCHCKEIPSPILCLCLCSPVALGRHASPPPSLPPSPSAAVATLVVLAAALWISIELHQRHLRRKARAKLLHVDDKTKALPSPVAVFVPDVDKVPPEDGPGGAPPESAAAHARAPQEPPDAGGAYAETPVQIWRRFSDLQAGVPHRPSGASLMALADAAPPGPPLPPAPEPEVCPSACTPFVDKVRARWAPFGRHFGKSCTGGGGGYISRGEGFVVGNFVFQMCAKFPAQFSGHGAK